MAAASFDKTLEDITKEMNELSVLSFRTLDDVKKLSRHFGNIINHPTTQKSSIIINYLKKLQHTHREILTQKRECVEVEYIFTTEKKSSLQRQRFNSLPVSEVPELLKTEFPSTENAQQVHICTDCNVAIEMHDDLPLMESLQKHFNLEVHQPKLKRESIDVAEPIVLPNMSRRLSAMAGSELPNANLEQIAQTFKSSEKLDRSFASKLEASLIKYLPDKSESSIDAAIKFYQDTYEKLCQEISTIDFTTFTSSVAPIIMSIKDNVNQNFAADANKNYDNDENEQVAEKPAKNQAKKYRHYGPIENSILELLNSHKLLSLTDDRTGKPAFFCIACEYYTLRFRYDSVLNHIFSETHVHNLACLLQSDEKIPFTFENRTIEKIKESNEKFLISHNCFEMQNFYSCLMCKVIIENPETAIMHILEETHLAKMSDKIFRTAKASNGDGALPDEWGPKNLDWAKYLAGTSKALRPHDPLVRENFIKPSGKVANYCSCCDMTLKGPRQVLFNHIRQKKHLRNAAPLKLNQLYKNYCRPSEYYASFGNYYICSICPNYIAEPSFAAISKHFESATHINTVSALIRSALYKNNIDISLMQANKIEITNDFKCNYCDISFPDASDAVSHILSSVKHQNFVTEAKYKSNKGDIINVYMNGNYVLHSEGVVFNCVVCNGVFNSLRSLLMHLNYADHFAIKLTSEDIFRFYLELKHNINLLARNKYVYQEFGKLKCGVCGNMLEENENAKKHVASQQHRDRMGGNYVNIENANNE